MLKWLPSTPRHQEMSVGLPQPVSQTGHPRQGPVVLLKRPVSRQRLRFDEEQGVGPQTQSSEGQDFLEAEAAPNPQQAVQPGDVPLSLSFKPLVVDSVLSVLPLQIFMGLGHLGPESS